MIEDLSPFYEAMQKEYERHYFQKGDSWKDEIAHFKDGIELGMELWLSGLLDSIYHRYDNSRDIDELVDLANVAAMIWIRGSEQKVSE